MFNKIEPGVVNKENAMIYLTDHFLAFMTLYKNAYTNDIPIDEIIHKFNLFRRHPWEFISNHIEFNVTLTEFAKKFNKLENK